MLKERKRRAAALGWLGLLAAAAVIGFAVTADIALAWGGGGGW